VPEGLDNAFARHARLAEACRRAVRGLGLEILCRKPRRALEHAHDGGEPAGFDGDAFVRHAYDTLNFSLGVGLGAVKGKVIVRFWRST
jgi:alanine-glyoxylate transaminase/serine-glyoxylate transaminase/serine-pyruvate transaminase